MRRIHHINVLNLDKSFHEVIVTAALTGSSLRLFSECFDRKIRSQFEKICFIGLNWSMQFLIFIFIYKD